MAGSCQGKFLVMGKKRANWSFGFDKSKNRKFESKTDWLKLDFFSIE
jgi:hypothetical protein